MPPFGGILNKSVSRVLSPAFQRVSIIYLDLELLPGSCSLPIPIPTRGRLRRAASKSELIWPCNSRGFPRRMLPQQLVSSYLTFSPFPRFLGVVIFCGTFCYSGISAGIPPLFAGQDTLCCPDFPT
jgi:hypothetical protein